MFQFGTLEDGLAGNLNQDPPGPAYVAQIHPKDEIEVSVRDIGKLHNLIKSMSYQDLSSFVSVKP